MGDDWALCPVNPARISDWEEESSGHGVLGGNFVAPSLVNTGGIVLCGDPLNSEWSVSHPPGTENGAMKLCQRESRRTKPLITATVILWGCMASSAVADKCVRQTEATAKSFDGRFVVTARVDANLDKWGFVCEDTKEKKTWQGTLRGVKQHAHLTILVAVDGLRFAVFDPTAGHRTRDRLLIYTHEGKLVKSFAVKDLLNEEELQKVGSSISHIQWSGYDRENRRSCWLEDGGTMVMRTMADRFVRVSMADAKVLPPVKEDLDLREFLLEDLFQRHVEIVTPESLSRHIGPHILEEIEYVPVAA